MIKDFEELHQNEEKIKKETNDVYREFTNLTDSEKLTLRLLGSFMVMIRPIYDGTMPTQ
jgi:hypothetical protein